MFWKHANMSGHDRTLANAVCLLLQQCGRTFVDLSLWVGIKFRQCLQLSYKLFPISLVLRKFLFPLTQKSLLSGFKRRTRNGENRKSVIVSAATALLSTSSSIQFVAFSFIQFVIWLSSISCIALCNFALSLTFVHVGHALREIIVDKALLELIHI